MKAYPKTLVFRRLLVEAAMRSAGDEGETRPKAQGRHEAQGRPGGLIQSGLECSNYRLDLVHMLSYRGGTFESRGSGPSVGHGRGHGSGASRTSPTAPTAPKPSTQFPEEPKLTLSQVTWRRFLPAAHHPPCSAPRWETEEHLRHALLRQLSSQLADQNLANSPNEKPPTRRTKLTFP